MFLSQSTYIHIHIYKHIYRECMNRYIQYVYAYIISIIAIHIQLKCFADTNFLLSNASCEITVANTASAIVDV